MSHKFDSIHTITGMGNVQPPFPDPNMVTASYRPYIILSEVTEVAWRVYWTWNDEIVRRGMGSMQVRVKFNGLGAEQYSALEKVLHERCPNLRCCMAE